MIKFFVFSITINLAPHFYLLLNLLMFSYDFFCQIFVTTTMQIRDSLFSFLSAKLLKLIGINADMLKKLHKQAKI